MPRALGLARIPTLDPKEKESEYPSYEYVRSVVRTINTNFDVVNNSYQNTGALLDETSQDDSGTTVMVGSVTNPTYTINYARSKRIGPMVDLVGNISFTANGSGVFYTALPYNHRANGGLFLTLVGNGHGFDASTGIEKLFIPQLQFNNVGLVRWLDVPNCVQMGATTPWTWAAGDAFEWAIRYEAEA